MTRSIKTILQDPAAVELLKQIGKSHPAGPGRGTAVLKDFASKSVSHGRIRPDTTGAIVAVQTQLNGQFIEALKFTVDAMNVVKVGIDVTKLPRLGLGVSPGPPVRDLEDALAFLVAAMAPM